MMRSLLSQIGTLPRLFAVAVALSLSAPSANAAQEPPDLVERIESGELPPLAERLPDNPRVIDTQKVTEAPGRYGGTLSMLMARSKDIRMMTVFSYARLVCFDTDFNLVADILEDFTVEDGRIFTLKLRPGHKWSDGMPFTAEDFRYFWEDIATNEDLSRGGPPQEMLVEGQTPIFEVLDDQTVRYTWSKPNPLFLPSLAGARPNYIYRPAHYLKQFHANYADPKELEALVKTLEMRDWIALHTVKSRQYRPENPDLPRLDPWVNSTPPPAERFVFKRNPFFHRIDTAGRQLPYVDTVYMRISSADIIAPKTGSGDSDLQARYLRFDDYTFLKQAEKTHPFTVRLWSEGTGSKLAFLPNLNTNDKVLRDVFRDRRFRRALSLAVNRREINQQFFYGLAEESANTVLPASPLFRPAYADAYTSFDPKRANELLDEMGLKRDGPRGPRMLRDGRPVQIVIEYSGGDMESDIIELVSEHWAAVGIKIYQRGLQRDNLRRRFLAGETQMSVWSGLILGLATPDLPPEELAPVSSAQGQWPKWGEYTQTGGKAGEPVDGPAAAKLLDLFGDWRTSATSEERERIWHQMLTIHAEEVFTIGTVNGTLQPVVTRNTLMNVPKEAVYTFSPTAFFGVYMPDTFWFAEAEASQ